MKLPFLFLIAVGLSAAPATITWSTPVVDSAVCGGCEFDEWQPSFAIDGGTLDTQYQSQGQDGGFTDSVVTDTFTVTTPADFTLSAIIDMSSSGIACLPFSCFPRTSWDLTGEFSGSLEVTGSNGTVFDFPFSQSGSVAGECGAFGPGVCTAGFVSNPLALNESNSGTVFLPVGTYTASLAFSDQIGAGSEDSISADVAFTVTVPVAATPEPEMLWLLVAGCLLVFVLVGRVFNSNASSRT